MNNPFAQLTSVERRFLAGVAVALFLVLNIFFVWPRFGDWKKTNWRWENSNRTLKMFQDEIAQKSAYEAKLKDLESQGGAFVPPEDQSAEFLRAVQSQAAQSGVTIVATTRQPARTNQFFLEQIQSARVTAGEPQLVDFLYKLGAGNSLIRVRELSVQPDVSRMALSASIKLVASYQKKAPAARPAPATATKPATPTAKKP